MDALRARVTAPNAPEPPGKPGKRPGTRHAALEPVSSLARLRADGACMGASDRVEDWDTSRWSRGTAKPEDGDAVPELSPDEVLALQACRDYRHGQTYAVFVPSPLARTGQQVDPVLRYRVCADPGDLADGGTREPVFVTTSQWDALQRAEDRASDRAEYERQLDELRRMAPKASPAAEVLGDTTPLRQLADELGLTVETVKRRLRTAEVPLIELSSHDYRVRNDDLREWLEACANATDPRDASAIIDACRDATGQGPRRARFTNGTSGESDDADDREVLRRRIADL